MECGTCVFRCRQVEIAEGECGGVDIENAGDIEP